MTQEGGEVLQSTLMWFDPKRRVLNRPLSWSAALMVGDGMQAGGVFCLMPAKLGHSWHVTKSALNSFIIQTPTIIKTERVGLNNCDGVVGINFSMMADF